MRTYYTSVETSFINAASRSRDAALRAFREMTDDEQVAALNALREVMNWEPRQSSKARRQSYFSCNRLRLYGDDQ